MTGGSASHTGQRASALTVRVLRLLAIGCVLVAGIAFLHLPAQVARARAARRIAQGQL